MLGGGGNLSTNGRATARPGSKNVIRNLFESGGRSSSRLELDLDNFYQSRTRRRTQFAHQISSSLQTAGIAIETTTSDSPVIPNDELQSARRRGMHMTLSPGEEYENYQKLNAAMSKLAASTSAAASPLAFTASEAIDEGDEEDEDNHQAKQKQAVTRKASQSGRGNSSRSRRGSGKLVSHPTGDEEGDDQFFDSEIDDEVERSVPTVDGGDGVTAWSALKDILSVASAIPRRLSRVSGMKSATISPLVAPDTVGGALPPFVGATMPRARLHSQRSIRGRENLVQIENKNMVDPLGRFRLGWDVTSMCFILYNAIVLPFQVSFESSAPDSGFETFLDAYFLADILVTFNTAVDREGTIRYDRTLAASTYLRSWFLIDLTAALPYTLIFQDTDASASFKRAVKLLRLIRLLRLLRVSRILHRIQNTIFIRSTLSALIKYLLMVLLLSHWFSCAFHAIGAAHQAAGNPNWIADQKLEDPIATKWDRYVAALYFAFQTLATIGYGDVAGVNPDEMLFSVFAMIAGGGVFAYGLTNIVDLVSSLTIQETRFRQKMDEVNEYMNARELPLKLRMEIREFYHNTRQSRESKLNSEHQILSDLSSKLRSKIALSINDQFLRKFPFFTGSDPNFLMELALNMRMIHFAPLEDVIIEGEIGHEMFFIFRGAVEVRKDDTRIGILGENQYFGEMAILNPDCRRTATVRTLCFCELRMLSRTRFLEALALFPSMQVKMAQIAKGRAFPLAAIKAKANAAVAVAPAETAGAIETPTKRGSVNRSPSVTKRGIHSIDGVSAVTTAAGTAGASDEASDLLPTLPLTAATRRKSFVRGMSQLELVQQYNGDSFQPVRATTSARISSAVHRSSGSASSISAAGAGRSGSLSGGNGGTGVTPAMSMAISEIASLLDESVRQQHALMHQMNSLKARLDRHISLANREKKAKTDQLPRHASLGS